MDFFLLLKENTIKWKRLCACHLYWLSNHELAFGPQGFIATHSPSQSAPTILVLKTWVVLWPWKKIRSKIWSAKSRVQKTRSLLFKKRRGSCPLLFLNNNDPVFCTLLFAKIEPEGQGCGIPMEAPRPHPFKIFIPFLSEVMEAMWGWWSEKK